MQILTYTTLSLLFMSISFTSCNGQATIKQEATSVIGQQSFTGKHIMLTKTQGSSEHQNVHCSLEDNNGGLWFGTTGEGVYRYDGKVFTQYTEKDGLSSNTVWSILEDRSGNIWFGTDDGLSRYDGKRISKVPIIINSATGFKTSLPRQERNAVWSIFQDKNGIIWFGTSADLYCYDGKSFSRFLDKRDISNKQKLKLTWIQCFIEDRDGTIWMGSGPMAMEGVIRFDGKSIAGSKPNGDGWIRSIVEDKNKKLWFGGRSHGNFTFDGKNFLHFNGTVGIGNPILADSSGNIWFCGEEKNLTVQSEGGIFCYDGTTFKNYNSKNGMSKYYVFNMLEDSNGSIWIGTRNCGLIRYNGQHFTAFSE